MIPWTMRKAMFRCSGISPVPVRNLLTWKQLDIPKSLISAFVIWVLPTNIDLLIALSFRWSSVAAKATSGLVRYSPRIFKS
jgi:hypothetical protein